MKKLSAYEYLHFLSEIKKYVDKFGNHTEAAKSIGISPQQLCDIFKGRKGFSEKVLNALGYETVIRKKK